MFASFWLSFSQKLANIPRPKSGGLIRNIINNKSIAKKHRACGCKKDAKTYLKATKQLSNKKRHLTEKHAKRQSETVDLGADRRTVIVEGARPW